MCRQGKWVVINFFRGFWCPVCCIAMLSMEKQCEEILKYATIMAISPEVEDSAMRQFNFSFDVLTDPDNVVGKQFGLVYPLTKNIEGGYAQLGFDLRSLNKVKGTNPIEFPLPGVYVASPPDGEITYCFVNEDFKQRAPLEKVAVHLAERLAQQPPQP
eukprot:TRINITY_DN1122_c0_g1_i1.p1 TRINITY_DN1122_c0_g1~~TRINITY_DN1122_c0_g1_i1.p1  ORF type:complete len:158 (-),score=37.74 TRINITY_DN1122_c0_g1_i1:98-571(-)